MNKGFLSSAIMQYLNWNSLDRQFYLFDTFCGFDSSLLNKEEAIRAKNSKQYEDCYEIAKKNFKEFKNTHLIRGSVPSTLSQVQINKVAYLSIDMNCAAPEIAAAEYFWPKMAKGGLIILDDYAYVSMTPQKRAFDKFAKDHHTQILSLPTGQGLLIAH
ncbi:MAG: class I SAM-dependent methyltransferase [Verrucomicrobia bacterium]|nr:class I SAM-dependent methyltransferase [Verrucomicrobiota bacterium]MBS0645390.1 class I SAM-dependent methyltransferase [Verrucomicrobiota bacterium]